MRLNFRWFLLIAAFAVSIGCCSGCSADRKAKRVILQAERTRSLVDFSELLLALDEKNLSRSLRTACQDLAIDIAKELVENFWQEGNADGMAELYKKLSDENTRQHFNTDELCEVIRSLQLKRLRELRAMLLLCDIRQRFDWQKGCFVMLEKAYRKTGNTELKKHIPVLIELGGILCGKAVSDSMLDVTDACARCRATGYEICYGCHGTGKCSMCKGRGFKISNPPPLENSRIGNLPDSPLDERVSCSKHCNVCSGTGYLTSSCKKCVGKKYIVNRSKLIRMYDEQYQSAMKILQVMLAEDGDNDSGTEGE